MLRSASKAKRKGSPLEQAARAKDGKQPAGAAAEQSLPTGRRSSLAQADLRQSLFSSRGNGGPSGGGDEKADAHVEQSEITWDFVDPSKKRSAPPAAAPRARAPPKQGPQADAPGKQQIAGLLDMMQRGKRQQQQQRDAAAPAPADAAALPALPPAPAPSMQFKHFQRQPKHTRTETPAGAAERSESGSSGIESSSSDPIAELVETLMADGGAHGSDRRRAEAEDVRGGSAMGQPAAPAPIAPPAPLVAPPATAARSAPSPPELASHAPSHAPTAAPIPAPTPGKQQSRRPHAWRRWALRPCGALYHRHVPARSRRRRRQRPPCRLRLRLRQRGPAAATSIRRRPPIGRLW